MIIAVGDIHCQFRELRIRMLDILNETFKDQESINFVQVGDFGLGFNDPMSDFTILNTINLDLIERKSHLWVIRGNHDNPSFWGTNGFEFSNIHFVENCIETIEDKVCYFAGGAVSINRRGKIQGANYWKDEIYTYDPSVFADYMGKIDLVFTHDIYLNMSSLDFLNAPIVKEYTAHDSYLEQDLFAQQHELSLLYDCIKEIGSNNEIHWYHGHYHHPYNVWNKEDNINIIGLDIFEFKEIL